MFIFFFCFLACPLTPVYSEILPKGGLDPTKLMRGDGSTSLNHASLLSMRFFYQPPGGIEIQPLGKDPVLSNHSGFFDFKEWDFENILCAGTRPFIIKGIAGYPSAEVNSGWTINLDFAYFPHPFPLFKAEKGMETLLDNEESSRKASGETGSSKRFNIEDGYVGLSLFLNLRIYRLMPYLWVQSGAKPFPPKGSEDRCDEAMEDPILAMNVIGGLPIQVSKRCSLLVESGYFVGLKSGFAAPDRGYKVTCSLRVTL